MANAKLTDYEVGNFALHRIADNCFDLSRDCAVSHPSLSNYLSEVAAAFVEFGQGMEEWDPKDPKNTCSSLDPSDLEHDLLTNLFNASN